MIGLGILGLDLIQVVLTMHICVTGAGDQRPLRRRLASWRMMGAANFPDVCSQARLHPHLQLSN
jgi:hypothetical protein